MKEDTLAVQLDAMISVIRFVGQGGEVKDSVVSTQCACYVFHPTDTYIRIEMEDTEHNLYLFNPIARTDFVYSHPSRAEVNVFKTSCKRMLIISGLLLLAFGIYWRKRKKNP